jgi:hypothetical protein
MDVEREFYDWEGRPAVTVNRRGFAMLKPGAVWTSVHRGEIWDSGVRVTEESFRRRFARYHPLDPLPQADANQSDQFRGVAAE